MLQNRNIFYGKVTDVNDPKGIGRIRVEPKIEQIAFIYPTDWNPELDKWGPKDPLIFLPLIPMYISQIPKVDEFVNIIFANNEERYDANKFYIQGPLTRPWNVKYEDFSSAQSVLASGEKLKQVDNFIDPETGKIRVTLEGIFPKPGDNAFLGRGSSDLVMVENPDDGSSSALLRSGKFSKSGNENIPVIKNDKRSFVQLSSYELENVSTGVEEVERETFDNISTKMYVEWSLNNLPVTATTYDGKVRLYSLPKNIENLKVENINESINILTETTIKPIWTVNFTGKSLSETAEIINSFITGVNEGKIQIKAAEGVWATNGLSQTDITNTVSPLIYPAGNSETMTEQFPFFYGPSYSTYQYVTGNIEQLTVDNASTMVKTRLLYDRITLSKGYEETGSGLVWKKTPPKLGILKNLVREVAETRDYIPNPITYSVVGGDKLFLLSHRSQDKFAIDLKNTLYGIPQTMLATEISDKTNSMVRGEELMNLLNKIVDFMLTHVHPFPGIKPIQEYPNAGVSGEKIQQIINNAENTILNQNIRIN